MLWTLGRRAVRPPALLGTRCGGTWAWPLQGTGAPWSTPAQPDGGHSAEAQSRRRHSEVSTCEEKTQNSGPPVRDSAHLVFSAPPLVVFHTVPVTRLECSLALPTASLKAQRCPPFLPGELEDACLSPMACCSGHPHRPWASPRRALPPRPSLLGGELPREVARPPPSLPTQPAPAAFQPLSLFDGDTYTVAGRLWVGRTWEHLSPGIVGSSRSPWVSGPTS